MLHLVFKTEPSNLKFLKFNVIYYLSDLPSLGISKKCNGMVRAWPESAEDPLCTHDIFFKKNLMVKTSYKIRPLFQ